MPADLVPYTITYRSPGAQPPVFLAGSFTSPKWLTQEMQLAVGEDGEHVFKTQVSVEPGRDYHFKFKVGKDDGWVLDESKPVATDELGNESNLLKVAVERESVGQQPHSTESVRTRSKPPAAPSKGSLAKIKEAEEDRRSSTPIEQVARTAAEVADTAEKLDAEESSPPPQASASGGESETEEDLRTPLFAHECFGAYEFVDDGLDHDACVDNSQRRASRAKSTDFAIEEEDLNDPTLERFPSDKPSVLDALRKIQSSLGEDQVTLDDLRFSIRYDLRRASVDSDDSILSAGSLSPAMIRRRENRLSSSGRNRSLASLGSIAEEPKAGGAEGASNQSAPSSPHSKNESHFTRAKSPTIDEGETLMMRSSKG